MAPGLSFDFTLALISGHFLISLLFNSSAFDNRTKSAKEIWRQMQATRYQTANPSLKINTDVTGTPDAPEVTFKFIDDTEVRSVSQNVYPLQTVCRVLSLLFLAPHQ